MAYHGFCIYGIILKAHLLELSDYMGVAAFIKDFKWISNHDNCNLKSLKAWYLKVAPPSQIAFLKLVESNFWVVHVGEWLVQDFEIQILMLFGWITPPEMIFLFSPLCLNLIKLWNSNYWMYFHFEKRFMLISLFMILKKIKLNINQRTFYKRIDYCDLLHNMLLCGWIECIRLFFSLPQCVCYWKESPDTNTYDH